jgi:hypothetical protein
VVHSAVAEDTPFPKGPPKSSVGGTPGWNMLSSARRYGWPPSGLDCSVRRDLGSACPRTLTLIKGNPFSGGRAPGLSEGSARLLPASEWQVCFSTSKHGGLVSVIVRGLVWCRP